LLTQANLLNLWLNNCPPIDFWIGPKNNGKKQGNQIPINKMSNDKKIKDKKITIKRIRILFEKKWEDKLKF
jgi:hypothetical protein